MPDSPVTKHTHDYPVSGAGLGLRLGLVDELWDSRPEQVDFLEVAPENWMRVGGARGKALRHFTERYPLVCHGLSLSIGGPAPLDDDFLGDLKGFLAEIETFAIKPRRSDIFDVKVCLLWEMVPPHMTG